MVNMKIVSWNVNGIRAIVKKDFVNSVEKIDPDILCLQETKAQDIEVRGVITELSVYHVFTNSADKKGYSSTAILSKEKPITVTNDMGVEKHDMEGRIQCAEFNDFYLVNVYVPNSGQGLKRLDYRQKWDEDFKQYLIDLQKKKPVIVCGDLNVAHQAIDLKNDKSNYNKTSGYTQIEIDGMSSLLHAGFVDTFRFLHPETIAYSYWSYRFNARARNTGWRIDYFLVDKSLLDKVVDSVILSDYFGSDHCPISLIIDL